MRKDEPNAEKKTPPELPDKYKPFKLKKRSIAKTPIEELDTRIKTAEEKLRSMDLEHEVWLKQPLEVDPSYNLCFSLLEDTKGIIMVQQMAGQTLRLMDAPCFLKEGACKQLDQLIGFATNAQDRAKPAKNPQDGVEKSGDDLEL